MEVLDTIEHRLSHVTARFPGDIMSVAQDGPQQRAAGKNLLRSLICHSMESRKFGADGSDQPLALLAAHPDGKHSVCAAGYSGMICVDARPGEARVAAGLGDGRRRQKAETLLRNLARRLEKDWEGVSASILEGLDEMLTVTRLGLPPELRRSLACTNIIENVMGTVRRVCRNVKYLRSPSNGSALGRRRHAGSRQELSPAEGPQAVASLEGRARRAQGESHRVE
jgi:hypothetical protein